MLYRENKIRKYHTSSAADLIKETMDYYNITQSDLAKRIGVSQKNVSEILQRKRFVNEIIALRLERVMGLSSLLLLDLDAKFKLREAKENFDKPQAKANVESSKFLKRYGWVHS